MTTTTTSPADIKPRSRPRRKPRDARSELARRQALLVKVLWSVSEIVELTNLHEQTVYKAIADNELTSAWICGKVLIPRDALVRKFGTDFPALMQALQLEVGPIPSALADVLETNRRAFLKILWSASEVAASTGLHPQTIYKAVDTGEIVSSRMGTKILIPRDPFLAKFKMDVKILLESLRLDAVESKAPKSRRHLRRAS